MAGVVGRGWGDGGYGGDGQWGWRVGEMGVKRWGDRGRGGEEVGRDGTTVIGLDQSMPAHASPAPSPRCCKGGG